MIGHSIVYWARCDWCVRTEDGGNWPCESPRDIWEVAIQHGWTRNEVGDRTLELCRPCSDRFKTLGPFHTNGGINPAYGTTPTMVEVPQ